jgi:hypothetical protein
MVEPRHAVEQVHKCDIQGCKNDAERSVSGKKVEKAGMSISSDPDKNAHLCREHYREYKKKTKSDRTYERLGW